MENDRNHSYSEIRPRRSTLGAKPFALVHCVTTQDYEVRQTEMASTLRQPLRAERHDMSSCALIPTTAVCYALVRRKRSRDAGEIVGLPGPWGKPALDVATVMRNEDTLYPARQESCCAPYVTAAPSHVSQQKRLHN